MQIYSFSYYVNEKIVVMSYILDLKFVNIEFEYLLKKSRFAICLWSSPTWFKRCVWVMLNMYWKSEGISLNPLHIFWFSSKSPQTLPTTQFTTFTYVNKLKINKYIRLILSWTVHHVPSLIIIFSSISFCKYTYIWWFGKN